jgi:hypothetical protein
MSQCLLSEQSGVQYIQEREAAGISERKMVTPIKQKSSLKLMSSSGFATSLNAISIYWKNKDKMKMESGRIPQTTEAV